MSAAVEIRRLSHAYGSRKAVDDLSLEVRRGELFAFLGPNGSGKTTLFRVLSTLIPLQQGDVALLGRDLRRETIAIRERLGVVFQAPSLDRKLTVRENLAHQGRLYGLAAAAIASRTQELLAAVGMSDRLGDLVETLSGGMRRRVEIAKALLHRPELVVLDEPSTGLDPGVRSELWKFLVRLRDEQGVTIVLTTHLLDEAERADRVAVMHLGRLAALDAPEALRAAVGGDAITIHGDSPETLRTAIAERFGCEVMLLPGAVRLEQPQGHLWVAKIVEAFGDRIQTITLGKPTLEDAFIDLTGSRFEDDAAREAPPR
jgi:ABC-2 type transport system ATP-binding protein